MTNQGVSWNTFYLKARNDFVFELGCGTGGVLKRIKETYGQDVVIGGSDLSKNAIERIRLTFPNEMENFHVGSMIQKQFVPDNSQDHVLRYSAEFFLSTCLIHQRF